MTLCRAPERKNPHVATLPSDLMFPLQLMAFLVELLLSTSSKWRGGAIGITGTIGTTSEMGMEDESSFCRFALALMLWWRYGGRSCSRLQQAPQAPGFAVSDSAHDSTRPTRPKNAT